jgi:hypothetical protein
MALLGGTAAAAAWSFGAHGLQSLSVQIYPGVASPDGRFIAFETQFSLPHDSRTYKPLAVWVFDVERAEPQLVAWAGRLPRNVHGGFQEPWSDELGLQFTRYDPLNAPDGATTLRLDIEDGALREREITELQPGVSPHVPEWAQWTRGIATERDHYTLRVRWKGTEYERVFRGDGQHSQLARGVLLSPTPGRALARRENRLVLVDFASEQETVLIEGLSKLGMRPSPDAKAVLVRTETHTHVLSTLDGSPLHAPWANEEWQAEWITGDERSHEVHLCPRDASGFDRIVDLEAKREYSIPMFPLGYVTRLADRGYVLLSASEDLLLLDREGRPIKTLLTRDRD